MKTWILLYMIIQMGTGTGYAECKENAEVAGIVRPFLVRNGIPAKNGGGEIINRLVEFRVDAIRYTCDQC